MSSVAAPPALPQVAILPVRNQPGANALSDQVDALAIMPFMDAFLTHFKTDAHFVPYFLKSGDEFPRMNLPIAPRIRAQGDDIMAWGVVLDYDNPGHTPHSPGTIDALIGKLDAMAAEWPLAMQWTLFYQTRGGARLVYVFDSPVPVEQAAGVHRGLAAEFAKRGLPGVDQKVWDWTRCFRLPWVVRDRVATWEETPTPEMIEFPNNRIMAANCPSLSVDEITKPSTMADIQPFTDPKPSPDYARACIEVAKAGRLLYTDWYRQAQYRLKGRDCYDCLFLHAPLAERGGRDNTLMSYLGSAVSLLFRVEGTRPEHIYGLFLPVVEQLEPDRDTPDWTDALWSKIGRLWAAEEAKRQGQIAAETAAAQTAVALVDRLRAGVTKWPSWTGEPPTDEWITRHAIVSINNLFFLMNVGEENAGTYDSTGMGAHQLIAALRTRGLDTLLDTKTLNKEGISVDRPVSQVINQYATIAKEMQSKPGQIGGYLERWDEKAVLQISNYRRNPKLVPEYNALVQEFLEELLWRDPVAGLAWCANAGNFEGGAMCALSIAGAAGSGKKLLAVGLSEMLEEPCLAGPEDIIGKHAYGLLRTPFLVVNEGWPIQPGAYSPIDSFRQIVAGDELRVEPKFQAPMRVVNPVRVLLTANNNEVVKKFCKGRDLSPDDRQSLAERIQHHFVGDRARVWLQKHGGINLTRGWIRGDGGEPSKYIFAKHLLWMYENRHLFQMPDHTGSRWLVEGNSHHQIIFEMRTQGGSGPVVIEAILRMLESPGKFDGLVIHKGRIWVTVAEVKKFFRSNMRDDGERLSMGQISSALVSLGVSGKSSPPAEALHRPMRVEWHELDLTVLREVARQDGWPSERLAEVFKERESK